MEILQSARNWGRVDLIGGGSTSSALKRERMEEIRKALAELDVILGYFRKKFRETPVVSKISYEEWGDDLFAAEWVCHRRIGAGGYCGLSGRNGTSL